MKKLDKVDFDFSSLYELLQDMKRSFWFIERSQERFTKSLSRQHNNYYQKLIPEKRKQIQDEKQLLLKNQIMLTHMKKKPKQSKLVVEDDLADEMKRRQEAQLANTALSQASPRTILRQPTLYESVKEYAGTGGGGGLQVGSPSGKQSPLKHTNTVRFFDEAIQQQKPLAINKTISNISDRSRTVVNLRHGSESPNKLISRTINHGQFSRQHQQQPLTEESFIKFATDWFAFAFNDDKDAEMDKQLENNLQSKKMEDTLKIVDTLFSDRVRFIQYYDFHKIIKEDKVRDKVVERLFSMQPELKLSVNELNDAIKESDKDLFIKFRDALITYDQLRARTAERRYKVKYQVLDDLKDKLDPSFYEDMEAFEPYFKMIYSSNPNIKELLRELEPYETNKKCLKSIKYHYKKAKGKKSSYFFRSIGRDKGRNIFTIKTNDYQRDQQQDDSQIKLNKSALEQLSQDEKPIKAKSEVRPKIKKAKSRLNPKDQEELLKQVQKENIKKLKKQLIHSLWQHKLLLKQSMPYDSNTEKHQDNKDSFFFGIDSVKPEADPAKLKFLKSKKSLRSLHNPSTNLNTYQIKKHQAYEKKKNILFLKRLENDGEPVRMHQIEKDLLRLYSNQEEEEAQRELEQAMVDDVSGVNGISRVTTKFKAILNTITKDEGAIEVLNKELEKERLKELAYSSAKALAVPKIKKVNKKNQQLAIEPKREQQQQQHVLAITQNESEGKYNQIIINNDINIKPLKYYQDIDSNTQTQELKLQPQYYTEQTTLMDNSPYKLPEPKEQNDQGILAGGFSIQKNLNIFPDRVKTAEPLNRQFRTMDDTYNDRGDNRRCVTRGGDQIRNLKMTIEQSQRMLDESFDAYNSNKNYTQLPNQNRMQQFLNDYPVNQQGVNNENKNQMNTTQNSLFMTEVSSDFKQFVNRFGIPYDHNRQTDTSITSRNKSSFFGNTRVGTANSLNPRRKIMKTLNADDDQYNPTRERLKTALALNKQSRQNRMNANISLNKSTVENGEDSTLITEKVSDYRTNAIKHRIVNMGISTKQQIIDKRDARLNQFKRNGGDQSRNNHVNGTISIENQTNTQRSRRDLINGAGVGTTNADYIYNINFDNDNFDSTLKDPQLQSQELKKFQTIDNFKQKENAIIN